MARYRIIARPAGKPQTPWRETRAEAIEDAIEAGWAERDEFVPDRIFWHPLAEVEEE